MGPGAIAIAALAVAVIGTTISAVGQHRAGQAAKAAHRASADEFERRAGVAESVSRRKLKTLQASQRARYAKAGVDFASGSPLLLLAESAEEGEREIYNIRRTGVESGRLERYFGRQAGRAGSVAAGGTLLTGLGRAGLSYYAATRGPQAQPYKHHRADSKH